MIFRKYILFLILNTSLSSYLGAQKAVSLIQLLENWSNNHQITFAYDPDALKDLKAVEISQGESFKEGFIEWLKNMPLEATFLDERHILLRKTSLWNFKGRVVDGKTGAPLAYAAVYLPNTGIGVETDDWGRFDLNIPDSLYSKNIAIQYLGYESKNTPLQPGYFQIPLFSMTNEVKEVIVDASVPTVISLDNPGNYSILGILPGSPSLQSDPIGQLKKLPGVSVADDFSSGIRIRGSGVNDNLLVIDGITLYNLDHFYGIISALNPWSVEHISFYKNNFPVQYGGITGGVIDIKTKIPEENFTGIIDLNLLDASVELGSQVTKDLKVSGSIRSSINNLAKGEIFDQYHNFSKPTKIRESGEFQSINRRITEIQPRFSYHDVRIKLNFRSHQFSLFQSVDRVVGEYSNNYNSPLRDIRIMNKENYEEKEIWSNAGFSWQSEFQWIKDWKSTMRINHSYYENTFSRDAELERIFPLKRESFSFTNFFKSEIKGTYLTWNNRYAKDGVEWNWGGEFTDHRVDNLVEHQLKEGFTRKFRGSIYSFFGNFEREQGDWKLDAGLRSNFYSLEDRFYFSPRVQAMFKRSVFFTISHYQQFLRQINNEDGLGQSREIWTLGDGLKIPVLRATNFTLGGKKIWEDGLSFEVEGYFKYLNGVVEYAPLFSGLKENPLQRQPLFTFFEGKGFIRGIDFFLKKYDKNFDAILSYTLSKQTQTFKMVANNRPFPAPSDRRHQLSLAGTYKLEKWSFGANYTFASGRPFTDLEKIALAFSESSRENLGIGDRVSYLEDYHRIDLSVDWETGPWKLGFGVYNLINRRNLAYRQYAFVFPVSKGNLGPTSNILAGNEVQLLGRTINARIQVNF